MLNVGYIKNDLQADELGATEILNGRILETGRTIWDRI